MKLKIGDIICMSPTEFNNLFNGGCQIYYILNISRKWALCSIIDRLCRYNGIINDKIFQQDIDLKDLIRKEKTWNCEIHQY